MCLYISAFISVKCNCLVQRKACIKCSFSFKFIKKKEKRHTFIAPACFCFLSNRRSPTHLPLLCFPFTLFFFSFKTTKYHFLYCYFLSETGKWYGLTAQYSTVSFFVNLTAQMTVIVMFSQYYCFSFSGGVGLLFSPLSFEETAWT